MNNALSRVGQVVVGLALVGLLAGCATNRPARFGQVSNAELAAGESTPRFAFTEHSGRGGTFDDVRGAVTLVAFHKTWCGETCSQGHELADLASRVATQSTPVTVVSVAPASMDCENVEAAFAKCNVERYAQYLALCDNEARIRNLYGPDSDGKFYIIDSENRISASGTLENMAGLERNMRTAVRAHERQAARDRAADTL